MSDLPDPKSAGTPEHRPHLADLDLGEEAYRRDRLLASLTLICGTALALALPFALRAGAEFFMPVTAALVIAIALVPVLEWLEDSEHEYSLLTVR